jgi:hypothetical protein
MTYGFLIYGEIFYQCALHKKDEDHKEEDAFIIQNRCHKNSENKKKQ